ncbi:MAG: hypothetical protein AB7S77_15345 [Desulfatirhabdiaceae bacterium]
MRRPAVRFRTPPAADIACTLGYHIADRLPSVQSKPWMEALSSSNSAEFQFDRKTGTRLIENPWPLSAAILVYPVKYFYGQDELIFWELKLMGQSADHSLFLEIILPAMETLSQKPAGLHSNRFSIWGGFDIQSVHVAKGHHWVPLVDAGKLDLRRRYSTRMWCKDLHFHHRLGLPIKHLEWITPVCLPVLPGQKRSKNPTALQLVEILDAWLIRASQLILGRWGTPEKLIAGMDDDTRQDLQEAIELAGQIPVLRAELVSSPKYGKNMWEGHQYFLNPIPEKLMPYLNLAAIFHVGQLTHYGCGTFVVD